MSEEFEITLEAGILDDLFVADGVEALSEDDIILDGVVDNPGLLGDQTHRSVDSHLWLTKAIFKLHFA